MKWGVIMQTKYCDGFENEKVTIDTFVGTVAKGKSTYYLYRCVCKKCDSKFIAYLHDIQKGRRKYCSSCRSSSKNFHVLDNPYVGTRIYRIWHSMKCRCYYEKHPCYKNYGGRGIIVCEEWLHNSKKFGDWAMANGYSKELTLDRIDVDGNYEPSNCRWVTMKEQTQNKSKKNTVTVSEIKRRTNGNVKYIEIDRISKPLLVWLDEYGITYKQYSKRVHTLKWDEIRAIKTPIRKKE